MSGDHNMYQKTKSYLDDFECPRCGHCCQSEVEWVGLTDGEIDALAMDEDGLPNSHIELARAIEAKLREKNHG